MAVFLTILKIIGIVLLSILGVLLLLLLLVLFVPVRYRIALDYHDKFTAKARASFLLHIIHVGAYFNDTEDYDAVVRVFGIPVYRLKKHLSDADDEDDIDPDLKAYFEEDERLSREESLREEERRKKDLELEKKLREEGFKKLHHIEGEESEGVPEGAETEKEQDAFDTAGDTEDEAKDETDEELFKKPFDKSFRGYLKWLKYLYYKVRRFIKNIKCSILRFCDKIKWIYHEYEFYERILDSDVWDKAFPVIKKQIVRILKHVLPRSYKGYVRYGLSDPAQTGKVLGYISWLYIYLRGNISIRPEFEEQCFEASLKMKGRVRIIVVLDIARRIYFNRNIRRIYRAVRKRVSGYKKRTDEQ